MKDEMTHKTEMAVLVTRRVPESHGGLKTKVLDCRLRAMLLAGDQEQGV